MSDRLKTVPPAPPLRELLPLLESGLVPIATEGDDLIEVQQDRPQVRGGHADDHGLPSTSRSRRTPLWSPECRPIRKSLTNPPATAIFLVEPYRGAGANSA